MRPVVYQYYIVRSAALPIVNKYKHLTYKHPSSESTNLEAIEAQPPSFCNLGRFKM